MSYAGYRIRSHPKAFAMLVVGLALTVFGLGIVFSYPFPAPSNAPYSFLSPYGILLEAAIASFALGVILVGVFAFYVFRVNA